MDNILEILKDIQLINNLFDYSEWDGAKLNKLEVSIQDKFDKNEINELNKILSKFNNILEEIK